MIRYTLALIRVYWFWLFHRDWEIHKYDVIGCDEVLAGKRTLSKEISVTRGKYPFHGEEIQFYPKYRVISVRHGPTGPRR